MQSCPLKSTSILKLKVLEDFILELKCQLQSTKVSRKPHATCNHSLEDYWPKAKLFRHLNVKLKFSLVESAEVIQIQLAHSNSRPNESTKF